MTPSLNLALHPGRRLHSSYGYTRPGSQGIQEQSAPLQRK